MNALRQHWEQMQPRERRMLAGGGAATVLLLLYALLWDPFQADLAQLEERVAAQRGTLAWMQGAAAEARALRGSARPTNGSRSLLALADETAKSHQLGEAVKRVQPDGQHTVRVWLEGAAFDDVLRWLDALSGNHGVKIAGLNVERIAASPGRVNARVALEAAP